MLTVSRAVGQRILIGDDVEVCVVSVSSGVVKLAIKAPRDVRILRDELRQAVHPQDRAASAPSRSVSSRDG